MNELPEVIGTLTNMVDIWCQNNELQTIPMELAALLLTMYEFEFNGNPIDLKILPKEFYHLARLQNMIS